MILSISLSSAVGFFQAGAFLKIQSSFLYLIQHTQWSRRHDNKSQKCLLFHIVFLLMSKTNVCVLQYQVSTVLSCSCSCVFHCSTQTKLWTPHFPDFTWPVLYPVRGVAVSDWPDTFSGELLCHCSSSWDKGRDVENSSMFGGVRSTLSLRKREAQRDVSNIWTSV